MSTESVTISTAANTIDVVGTTGATEPLKTSAVETMPETGKTTPEVELSGKPLPDDVDDPSVLEKHMDKDGNIKMPFAAFKSRIARAKKSELKSVFGTDDRKKILSQKEEYEKLLSEREKKHREELTELERVKEDHRKAVERADALEKQIERDREDRDVQSVETKLTGVAGKLVQEEYVEYALERFRKHMLSSSAEDVAEYEASEEKVAEWFDKWSERHPAMKHGVKEEKPRKVGLTNGAESDLKDSKKAGSVDPKDARTMSKAELRAKYGKLVNY